MTKPATYSYTIEGRDLDFTRRASITSLIGYLLSTAGEDAATRGFGINSIVEENHSWVLSKLAIEIIYRPTLDETITIHTWVSNADRLLSTRNFSITNQRGEQIVLATSKWCMIDLSTRTPMNLSKLGIASIDKPSPIDPPQRVDTSATLPTAQHRVRYSDIDFNQHVNTLRYIDMILNNTPIEQLQSDRGVRADIHFMSESRLGELLNIKCTAEDRHLHRFEISHEDGTISIKAQFDYK